MQNQNYKEYLESYAWKAVKKVKLDECPKCECCGVDATTVHHLSYERLGKERDDDIVSICDPCHYECHHVDGYQIKNDEEILRKRFEEVSGRFKKEGHKTQIRETKDLTWNTNVINRFFSLFESSAYVETNEGRDQGKYKINGFDYLKFLALSYELTLSKCGSLELSEDLSDGEYVSISSLNLGKKIPKDYFIKYIVYVARYNRGTLIKFMYKEILQDPNISGFLNIAPTELAYLLGSLAYLDLRFCSNELGALNSHSYKSELLVLPGQEQIDKLRKEFHGLLSQLGVIRDGLTDIIGVNGDYGYEGVFVQLPYLESIENKLGIRYDYEGISDEYFKNILK